MEIPPLHYHNLTREAISAFHKYHGGLHVELAPAQGKLLLAILNQREKIEQNLLRNTKVVRLLWDLSVLRFYDFISWVFFRRLQFLEHHVCAVDAAHGCETNHEGNYVFLLMPVIERDHIESRYKAAKEK